MKTTLEWLVNEISNVLELEENDIDIKTPFSHMGIKSMQLISVVAKLGEYLNRKLPSTLGFDYPNISSLSHYIDDNVVKSDIEVPCKTHYSPQNHSKFKNIYPISDGCALDDHIAVVGMACRFPGDCNTPDFFWAFLKSGKDGITKVPKGRWDLNKFFDPDPNVPGKTTTQWGGFLKDIDQFDPEFFGISPREAQSIDPQQRLILEVGWETLEDAGIDPAQIKGQNTGVFVGISGSDYGRLLYQDPSRLNLYSGTGNSNSIAANRLSYFLGLRGPSIALDTACSSSLVAVYLACQSLDNKECDLALAGGVNLILSPEMTIIFSKAGLMADDGRCKTFDARADGYVRSEGCGMVALKKYSQAIKDNNRIYGIIRGCHINQDGESNGLTVPNGLSQEMLIRKSLKKAGVRPCDVDYAETHGTGTAIGDPIEVKSLGKVLGEERQEKLILGSVKTNIGHLEQAAGMAGLIKVLLSLWHKTIPANLHFQNLNPLISLDTIPAKIPVKNLQWSGESKKRTATVSGFSFGGVNAHLVVEEALMQDLPGIKSSPAFHILTLSAGNEKTLFRLASEYADFIRHHPKTDLTDFCYTANAGRSDFKWRAALIGENITALSKKLANLKNHADNPDIMVSAKSTFTTKPAFLFTGQGSQYPGMGQQLYRNQPVFREALNQCHEILDKLCSVSLLDLLYGQTDSSQLNQTQNTQPALFSIEYALSKMYKAWGIEPSFVMGHSVGEFVAACIAGVFSLEDGLKLISARGRLIQSLPEGGKMVVCLTSLKVVNKIIAPFGSDISIAALNGPANTVISGKDLFVDSACEILSKKQISWVPLQTSHAFHSALMEPMIEQFRSVAEQISYKAPRIPYISNVTGQLVNNDEVCSPDYWCSHIRSTVMFEAGVHTLHKQGCKLFLEIGPTPILSGMATSILPDNGGFFASSLRRGVADEKSLLSGLGILYTQGININWREYSKIFHPKVITIPHYPFQRRRCWFEEGKTLKRFHPSGGTRVKTPLNEIIYAYECQGSSYFLKDHRVYGHGVMSGSTMAVMVMHKLIELFGKRNCSLESFFILEPLYIPEEESCILQVVFSRQETHRFSFEIFSTGSESPKENWRLHARGEAGLSPSAPQLNSPFLPDKIKKRCSQEIDSDKLYQEIWDGGLELGPHFRWIKRIWRQDGEALAVMREPDTKESCKEHPLPPGLIDSCTQVIFACLGLDKKSAYMFLGVDQLNLYHDPSGQLYCHMTLQTSQKENDLAIANYTLWDENKNLILQAQGVHLKRAPLDMLSFSSEKKEQANLYEIQWKKIQRNPMVHHEQTSEQWLVFTQDDTEGASIVKAFKAKKIACQLISPDKNRCYDPSWLDNYLLETQKRLSGLAGIIYLGIRNPEESDKDFSDCSALFNMVRILVQRDITAPIWIVTQGAQQIKEDTGINPIASLLWGLGKVIELEHPEIFGGLADLPAVQKNGSSIARMVEEIILPNAENQILFRENQCYVPRLCQIERSSSEKNKTGIRHNASYLITGGTGGLGIKLAGWLSSQGADHLILTARHQPSDKIINAIHDLEDKGVTVRFIQTDVAHRESLETTLKEMGNTMPPLKGIFHLAGVVDDGLITKLDWNRFVRVLEPKVKGAWNLHSLTQHLNLDHFVMFSSVASLLGSPGQSSYAAANAFMDSLSNLRQNAGLAGLSINWGPWAEVGMAARLEDKELYRWEKGGFVPLDTKRGYQALAILISDTIPQAAVMDVNWGAYLNHYRNDKAFPMLSDLIPKSVGFSAQDNNKSTTMSISGLTRLNPEARKTMIQELVSNIVTEVMWLKDTDNLDFNVSLMELGLDSLMAMELRNRFQKEWSVNLPLSRFLKSPTLNTLTHMLLSGMNTNDETKKIKDTQQYEIIKDIEHSFDPFPLTDIQHAYWMGRSRELTLGNVSCHVYPEVEIKDLDVKRLEQAVTKLVQRHEMLRAVMLPDGNQKILKNVPDFHIPVQDMRGWDANRVEQALQSVRNQMSHQILNSEQYPLFEVRASLLNNSITRLHISFDLLIGDGWSFNILIRDLYRYYQDINANLPPLELSFRNYVLTHKKIRQGTEYQISLEYWQKRLSDLPPAPELPLALLPEEIQHQRFIRLAGKMEKKQWSQLKARAARAGLTPSGVLLAAFCDVIAFWSKSPDFTINLTMFNRLPLHKQVNEIVGDFTTLTLLEVHNDGGQTFKTRAGAIQQQLWQDLEYRQVSGVEVLRQLARKSERRGRGLSFPVVFTSVLPYSGNADDGTTIELPQQLPVELVYCISQTPQVWLDHQIFEQNGALTFNWDLIEGLFPAGMIDDMFNAYCSLIQKLASDLSSWEKIGFNLIPESQANIRKKVNNTQVPISDKLLHALFFNQADLNPEKDALVTTKRRMTYKELALRAEWIGQLLQFQGVARNDIVAVVMEKGWEQVAATMGILWAGAAYLPIDAAMPAIRLKNILENGNVHHVLTQSWHQKSIEWPPQVKCIAVDKVDLPLNRLPFKPVQKPGDLAYVIYTSGSTGKPKGVMIDHRGAVNTILDINRRFGISNKERVIGLSELSFDLSVYDIFGTLGAGGTLVIPDADLAKDPAHWLEWIEKEGITLWNSVPQLMQMLIEFISAETKTLPDNPALIMLSGDWIPVDLPGKIKTCFPKARTISLGGATEASIWSIFYPINNLEPTAKSIPYGYPMANQQFHILNKNMEPCPDWVTGGIYISGIGLAKGYHHDEEKTRQSFITHPESQIPMYKTGDLGRYLPDGTIEFQGREDHQVKIGGYRIECGEIEAALNLYPGIQKSVVHAVQHQSNKNRSLVGYIVLSEESTFVKADLKKFLGQMLPQYMIPAFYEIIEQIPITANGKVDRKLLPVPESMTKDCSEKEMVPTNQMEQVLLKIFYKITQLETIAVKSNFFDLGIDSIQLVKIRSQIKKEFNQAIRVVDLFKHSTINSLSHYLVHNEKSSPSLNQADKIAEIRKLNRRRRTNFPREKTISV